MENTTYQIALVSEKTEYVSDLFRNEFSLLRDNAQHFTTSEEASKAKAQVEEIVKVNEWNCDVVILEDTK